MAIRTREADALLAKAAADPDLPAERLRLLAANRAVVAAQLGRLSEARRIWTEAALDDDDGQTAFELERFELELFTALAGGEFDRIYQRHTALMRTLEREAVDPVIALMARMVDTLYRRLAGEIGNVAAFLRSIEAQSVARPELAHLLVPGEATNRGANVWSIVATLDMALYQTDVEVGRRLVALAIRGADMTGLPHFRVSSRVVAAFVPGNDAARLFAEALDAAREVDDPRLAASVEAISHGRVPEVGPFRTLLSKMEASPLIVAVSSLRVELLRGEVTRAGDAIPLRARDFELLAAIAFARGSLSRAALAQRLWPNAPDEEAPGLRMSIHRLRRQLREVDAVVTEDMAYRLGPGVVVDVDEIEMFLRAARRLTALTALTERDQARLGETFAALASPLPERYAQWEWFGIYEPRLAELRVEAGTLLGESLIRDGQFEAALAVAATLMQLDPADEPAAELVVRAHLGAGRRAEATRAFRRYRDLLAAEFGAAPSAELAALVGGPDGDAAVTPLVRARTAR
jgi:DNA-binding SARP family transcriptional activator